MLTKSDSFTYLNSRHKTAVEAELQRLLTDKLTAAGHINAEYGDLLTNLNTLIGRGGKRLRPLLTILAYHGAGGRARRAIMPIAASQELFHAFILIHDDIIDHDVLRWGGPNIQGVYGARFAAQLGEEAAGQAADARALLAGDACLSLCYEALLAANFPSRQLLRAAQLVEQTLFTMIGGELADVAYAQGTARLGPEELLAMYAAKTATYSFITPLQLGATLAGASSSTLQAIGDFGRQLGIAFQIQDDILGIFGDETALGKPVLNDLREGKHTLLIEYTRQQATATEQKLLQAVLGNAAATAEALQAVRHLIKTSGALDQAQAARTAYSQRARALVPALGFSRPASRDLLQLITLLDRRTF